MTNFDWQGQEGDFVFSFGIVDSRRLTGSFGIAMGRPGFLACAGGSRITEIETEEGFCDIRPLKNGPLL